MKKVGLLINPIAGMGGKVGLKGTDGKKTLARARQLGAVPESEAKAVNALKQLLPLKEEILFLTAQGEMGERALEQSNFQKKVIYKGKKETDAKDSLQFLKALQSENVDLLLFVGGDGTARDVVSVIGLAYPVIGVPAGVKIHSPVYALTPEAAGRLAFSYLSFDDLTLVESAVIDIEEKAFREDRIQTSVYGYLQVSDDNQSLQALKSPSPQTESEAQISAALQIIDLMEDDTYYIIGSGSTPSRILEELQLPATQLGIDIIKNEKLIAKDVNEQDILTIIDTHSAKLVVTPMGGQGFLFGRGNQQLSDKVLAKLKKEDIQIVSTPGKIKTLFGKPLLIYTGNPKIDSKLSGYYKIIVGYGKYMVYKAKPA